LSSGPQIAAVAIALTCQMHRQHPEGRVTESPQIASKRPETRFLASVAAWVRTLVGDAAEQSAIGQRWPATTIGTPLRSGAGA